MREVDSEKTKPEMLKAHVWLQTSDGSIQEVEQEIAMFCPFICHEIHLGMGTSKNHPISLPSRVNTTMLSLILDYCRFHQVPGRSNKERKIFDEKFVRVDTKTICDLAGAADSLKLAPLVDLSSRAIARMMQGRTPEQIREIFHLPDDLTEEEKLEPIKNTMDDPRIRLWNRLNARKRKELEEKKLLKNTEAEEDHVDDRSVDDLLTYINGGNEDHKAGGTSKSKKKNRKKKDSHKAVSPTCSSTSNNSPSSSNVADINKEPDDDDPSCSVNSNIHHKFLPDIGITKNLLETGDHKIMPEDELAGCDLDDDIDPELKEKIDREVEDFARRLNLDWSLGQERRPLPRSISTNGSSRRFTRSDPYQK